MKIKMVFESHVIRNTEGKEIFRSDVRRAACDVYSSLVELFGDYSVRFQIVATERSIVDCEVIPFRYPNNSCHGEKAGKTHYRVYVNDEFVKELSFKPKPMALINAIAPGLDWKKINN